VAAWAPPSREGATLTGGVAARLCVSDMVDLRTGRTRDDDDFPGGRYCDGQRELGWLRADGDVRRDARWVAMASGLAGGGAALVEVSGRRVVEGLSSHRRAGRGRGPGP
jgi:hypothetical protein